MTLEEFINLIEVCGTEPKRWPADLQHESEAFLAGSSEAREFIQQHQQLDQLLDQVPVPEFAGLETRVLNQKLPGRHTSVLDRLIEWLLPAHGFGPQLWRPATAACLPLVFGIVLGNFYSFGVGLETDEFEYWEDELTMVSLNDISENGF